MADDYELLDFGAGRKLERFGPIVLDRPCPTVANLQQAKPQLWKEATVQYTGYRINDESHRGWSMQLKNWVPANWYYEFSYGELPFRMLLNAFSSGQVGLFPEQRENWQWIMRQSLRAKSGTTDVASLRVLNLFAYTGSSTLAAAAAGASVTHIDASGTSVEFAKRNAQQSDLADRPIRWIQEDATKFCRRELKRGNRYEAVILDPPSYGHGRRGETWKIDKDLLPLLKLCGELTAESRAFVLVTCHTPGIGPAELAAYLAEGIFGSCGQPPASGELLLKTAAGRRLPSGVYARWPR